MLDRIRILKHEGVKDSGSFEVRFPDGRRQFFYWDDVPSRRLRPGDMTSEQALEQAKAFARAERDKGGSEPPASWRGDLEQLSGG